MRLDWAIKHGKSSPQKSVIKLLWRVEIDPPGGVYTNIPEAARKEEVMVELHLINS